MLSKGKNCFTIGFLWLMASIAFAAGNKIQSVNVETLSGNQALIKVQLDDTAVTPTTFATDKPARIVVDFKNVKSGLKASDHNMELDVGVAQSINLVETPDRTRMVVNLLDNVPYETFVKGNEVHIKLASAQAVGQHTGETFIGKTESTIDSGYKVKGIDFRRGEQGAGRFIVDLSATNAAVDLKEEGEQIIVRFLGANLPTHLARKLDVTDFGTPVQNIEVSRDGRDVKVVINAKGSFENIAYQTDNRFTVDVRSLTEQEKIARTRNEFQYTGERLSLNFQDIEVRAVLQLIADFTGLNMVASDSVNGNVTLRLQNVPWDQALDIILKTKGLDKRRMGNVLLVAPTEEIAVREKVELQASQQVQDLAPLRSEFVQVNYAKASDIANLLKDKNNSLLSKRGNVSVDSRTNILLVQDTAEKIGEVRSLVNRLDVPIQQVLIESRIVIASNDFERALGIDFGLSARIRDKPDWGLAGNRAAAASVANGTEPHNLASSDRLNVQLPSGFSDSTAKSNWGLAIARLPGNTFLDLELSALENEGLGTIISSPRLITSNQTQAYIESGEELPFQEASSSGATSTSFKKAVLRLDVTPQITPDEKIVLDLTVNQDAKGEEVTSGLFAIDTKEIHTQVLVNNGETIVLGGVYQQTKTQKNTRIPFLGKLPVIGWLFSNDKKEDDRSELIIFVTPKIIRDGFTG